MVVLILGGKVMMKVVVMVVVIRAVMNNDHERKVFAATLSSLNTEANLQEKRKALVCTLNRF